MAIRQVKPHHLTQRKRRRILASYVSGPAGAVPASLVLSGNILHYTFDAIATQWDPNFKQATDAVNGLTVTDFGTGTAGTTRATTSKSSGKWQFETVFSGAAGWLNLGAGICQASHLANQWLSFDTVSWAYWATGNVYTNSASVDTVSAWTLGDVIGVLVDITAGKLWFTKNGAVIGGTNGGNPATGSGGYSIAAGVAWYPGIVFNSSVTDSTTSNFGASSLIYPVAGFQAWDTTASDTSTSPVTSLLHFDGTNGSTTFTDATGNHTFTVAAGAPVIDTSQSQFGSSSLHFTSTADQINGDGSIVFGTNPFTVDFWIKLNGTQAGQTNFFTLAGNGLGTIYIAAAGGPLRYYVLGDVIVGTTNVTTGVWHHIALTFDGANTYLFLDGHLEGSWASSSNYGTAAAGFPVISATTVSPVGWMDELHIVVGMARWTSNFTPPSSPYTTATVANNNWASLYGSPLPTLTTGQISNAISLASSQYVGFSSVGGLGLASQTSGYSACCWIKTTGTDCTILTLRNTGNSNTLLDFVTGYNGVTNINTGKLSVIIRGDSGTYTTIDATTAVNDNAWHHVAFTRTTGQLVTLYIDGVSNTSATDVLSGALTPNLAGSAIGLEIVAGGRPFIGLMDDFQIYNRALTSTEVNSIYSYTVAAAQQWQGTALLAGTGTLTASAVQLLQASAAAAGAGALTTPAQLLQQLTATAAGVGALSANAVAQALASANFAGSGALAAALAQRLTLQSTFAGAGGQGADAVAQALANANFAGAGALSIPAALQMTAQAGFAGVGLAPWATNDPSDMLFAASASFVGVGGLSADAIKQTGFTQWQGTALLAGAASLGLSEQQLLASSALWVGSGALNASAISQALAAATFAGGGALAVLTTLRQTVQAGLVGASSLSANAVAQALANASFVGVGTLSGTTTGLLQTALLALAGTGTLGADAIRQAGGGLQVLDAVLPAPAGAGALTAPAVSLLMPAQSGLIGAGAASTPAATILMPALSQLTGAGALNFSAVAQALAAASLNGLGSLGASPATLAPIAVAGWAGAGTLSASPARLLLAATPAALAGTGALTSPVNLLLAATPTAWASVGALAPTPLVQLLLLVAQSFAGAGLAQASTRQLLALAASAAGAGALTATPTQQMAANTLLGGVGALAGDLSKLGLQPLNATTLGAGALTAAPWQLMQVASAWLGVGSLAATAAMRMPMGITALVGAGAAAATPVRQVLGALPTAWPGSGLLQTASALQMSVGAVWAGVSTLLAASAQNLAGAALWSGTGAITADAQKFTGGVIQYLDPVLPVFGGAGVLTAPALGLRLATSPASWGGLGGLTSPAATVLLGANLTTWAGSGVLSTPAVRLLLSPSATLVGAGVQISSARQILAAQTTWAGASTLFADLLKTGQQQGNATLAGVGALTAALAQALQAQAAWAGAGVLTNLAVLQVHRPSAAWVGVGGFTSDLVKVGQQSLTATVVGVGSLSGAAALALAARGQWAGSGTAIAAASQTLSAAAQTWSGQGLLAVPSTSLLGRIGASLTGVGTFSANPFVLPGGSQLFPGAGSLTAAAILRMPARAALAGAGTWGNPAALLWHGGTARWSGAGQVSGLINAALALTGQWRGVGSISARLHTDYPIFSQINGSGRLQVALLMRSLETANLTGTAEGTLHVQGKLPSHRTIIGQQPYDVTTRGKQPYGVTLRGQQPYDVTIRGQQLNHWVYH